MTDNEQTAAARAVEALNIAISDAYRARHDDPPMGVGAKVDRDIAEAIAAAGWLCPEQAAEQARAAAEKAWDECRQRMYDDTANDAEDQYLAAVNPYRVPLNEEKISCRS